MDQFVSKCIQFPELFSMLDDESQDYIADYLLNFMLCLRRWRTEFGFENNFPPLDGGTEVIQRVAYK